MELLKALAPVSIPAAIIVVSLLLAIIVAAVVFGGLELEAGSGKLFNLKVTKAARKAAPSIEQTANEPTPELPNPSQEEVPVLVHDPVPQEPDEDESSDKGGANSDHFWSYLSAKSLPALDASFARLLDSLDPEDAEFWQTDYIRRRERLGADGAREAMRELGVQNPTWALPHATLLRWALIDHDIPDARKHLDAGLTKTQSRQFGDVLNAGVELLFKADGKEAALEFACRWSAADLPESTRAGVFAALADQLKASGDLEGFRIALEFASALQPMNDARSFALAYSYAENKARWALAIWNYQKCVGPDDDGPVARNNLGIVYSHIDKAVAISTYERASHDGDKFASANLAHLLIEDGYVAIAQSLLDAVEDPGNAAENHASAKKAALAKRRRTDEMFEKIAKATEADVEPYRASLAAAFRNLQNAKRDRLSGFFVSADRKAIAQLDDQKAYCQLRVGAVVLEGALQNQTTCFAGWLSTRGGGLLTSDISQFTLLNEGGGVLRLFRWPSAITLDDRVESFELRHTEDQPELADPPPSPPPPPNVTNFIANALLPKP